MCMQVNVITKIDYHATIAYMYALMCSYLIDIFLNSAWFSPGQSRASLHRYISIHVVNGTWKGMLVKAFDL